MSPPKKYSSSRFVTPRRENANARPSFPPPPATHYTDRNEAKEGTSKALNQQPSPYQFSHTPRFSTPGRFIASPSVQQVHQKPHHDAPSSTTPRRGLSLPRVESIEDESQSSLNLEDDPADVTPADPTTPRRKHFRTGDLITEDDAWQFTTTYSPKRRRLSSSRSPPGDPIASSGSSPQRFVTPSRPAQSAQLRSTPVPSTTNPRRFFPTASVAPPETQPDLTPARPTFLRQPVPASDQAATPLPDAFSPRKGTKDVPGGLAAEVRGWIAEISGVAAVARQYASATKTLEAQVIKNVSSGKDFRAIVAGSNDERVLLLGPGRGSKARNGSKIGLWAPSWDVELGGRRWDIGVDWRVINESESK